TFPKLPSLTEEQLKAMMKQPDNAYSRYELEVRHYGRSINNITKRIVNNYYHIIIEGTLANILYRHAIPISLKNNIPKPKELQQDANDNSIFSLDGPTEPIPPSASQQGYLSFQPPPAEPGRPGL